MKDFSLTNSNNSVCSDSFCFIFIPSSQLASGNANWFHSRKDYMTLLLNRRPWFIFNIISLFINLKKFKRLRYLCRVTSRCLAYELITLSSLSLFHTLFTTPPCVLHVLPITPFSTFSHLEY